MGVWWMLVPTSLTVNFPLKILKYFLFVSLGRLLNDHYILEIYS